MMAACGEAGLMFETYLVLLGIRLVLQGVCACSQLQGEGMFMSHWA